MNVSKWYFNRKKKEVIIEVNFAVSVLKKDSKQLIIKKKNI